MYIKEKSPVYWNIPLFWPILCMFCAVSLIKYKLAREIIFKLCKNSQKLWPHLDEVEFLKGRTRQTLATAVLHVKLCGNKTNQKECDVCFYFEISLKARSRQWSQEDGQ